MTHFCRTDVRQQVIQRKFKSTDRLYFKTSFKHKTRNVW